jgi:hypothetical protein
MSIVDKELNVQVPLLNMWHSLELVLNNIILET